MIFRQISFTPINSGGASSISLKRPGPWSPTVWVKYGEDQGGWEEMPPFAEGKQRQVFSQSSEEPSATDSPGVGTSEPELVMLP